MARRSHGIYLRIIAFACLALSVCLTACGTYQESVPTDDPEPSATSEPAVTANYLVSPLDEPDTCDFQRTTIHYTVALNVFDRLVETRVDENGETSIQPSLATSWDVSDDGLTYTFHLREGVTFSNGSPLTAEDVRYTFERLLSVPGASNQDIALDILGASKFAAREAAELEGVTVIDDHTIAVKLEHPYAAFLANLCMPGASILDKESTEEAGERFGKDPAATIGTGAFVFEDWIAGDRILLAANPTHWEGAPLLEGVVQRFVYEPETIKHMFDEGELDVVNLDDLGELAEYYLHGNAHATQLKTAPHVGIDYIALNESVEPLGDVRVRKALQLALDRDLLLEAALNGSGEVENGIFPRGLYGHNPELAPIPYDPEQAAKLLEEAGLADGFDLTISMRASSTPWQRQVMEMARDAWGELGVNATIELLDDSEWIARRIAGDIACYTASWAADYDDPDNFIYTFFGSLSNTLNRSLCYSNEDAMARVRAARAITNEDERLAEYRDLERTIVQDDAAWIPLFSRERHFLVSDRMGHFETAWNGWFETSFKYMSLYDKLDGTDYGA